MPTQITVAVADPEDAGKSMRVEVVEDFDTAVGLLIPMSQPSSALEARAALTLTRVDGGRLVVRPEHVVMVEELVE